MKKELILAGDTWVVEKVKELLIESGCCELYEESEKMDDSIYIYGEDEDDNQPQYTELESAWVEIAVTAIGGGALATIVKALIEHFESKVEIEYYNDGSLKRIHFEKMKKEEFLSLLRQIKRTMGM